MKRKFIAVFSMVLFLCLSIFNAEAEESWLRTEESGIVYSADYLHKLAEDEPRKAQEYLGKQITFVAPFLSMDEDIRLDYFGKVEHLLRLSVSDGREFWVDYGRAENKSYQRGELLKVSGKVSQLDPQCIMLLNVSGTPGWPNEIKIERIK